MFWQLRTQRLDLAGTPLIMGIVNVTPDSFFDGGRFFATQQAIDHALRLAADGADILDIGGESTRPYSRPVALNDELQRVLPVLEAVCPQVSIPVSIDTSKAAVAAAAIEIGAEIINDVTGLEGDGDMLSVARDTDAGLCVMHMQGTPQTMQDRPAYTSVVDEVYAYLEQRRDRLIDAGLDASRICLDPGIGFGKTHQHNLDLIRSIRRFLALGCPVLVGHSHKGFIAHLLGDKEVDRTAATIGVSLRLAEQGVHILRVHDVRQTRHALIAFAACKSDG